MDFILLSYYTDREKGIKNSLTDEHEKKLNDIGFAFKAAGNKDYQKLVQSKGIERFKSTWEKHFKDLKVSAIIRAALCKIRYDRIFSKCRACWLLAAIRDVISANATIFISFTHCTCNIISI